MIVSEKRRKSPETPGEETGGGRAEGGRGNREWRGWEEQLNVPRCCFPPADSESFLPAPASSF